MKKMRFIGLIAGAGLALGIAGQASAFHCYVADKPSGAGTATLGDIKPAGTSDNLVLPGAFINASEFGGPDQEVFFRGQPVDEEGAPVGLGTLPEAPHEAGSPDHGVLEID
jgi:hypothetical protein